MRRGAELKEMIISGGHTWCPLHLLRCQASEDVIRWGSGQTSIPKIHPKEKTSLKTVNLFFNDSGQVKSWYNFESMFLRYSSLKFGVLV